MTNFKASTASMLRNIANKRTTTMVVTIRNSERIKLGCILAGLVFGASILHAIMTPEIVGGDLVERVALSSILALWTIILYAKTQQNIARYNLNFNAFNEIANEPDDDKLLDKWVTDGYIFKLKEVEDKHGKETKDTCLIDFLDKVKDINSQADRIKTWDKVINPNFMRTAFEVGCILLRPVVGMVLLGRFAYIMFV